MKRLFLPALCALCLAAAGAQELPEGNVDIDALFDAPAAEEPAETPPDQAGQPAAKQPPEKPPAQAQTQAVQSVIEDVQKSGFSLNLGYSFSGGYYPRWTEAPWFWDTNGKEMENRPGIIMVSGVGLDVQISNVFHVHSAFQFSAPNFAFTIGDFYFDYIIRDIIFIRAGRTTTRWGISRNYTYTDLLSRVQTNAQKGDGYINAEGKKYYTPVSPYNTYILKVDIPRGIGGLQMLALIHDDFFNTGNIQSELISFGGKYNAAFKWADINAGIFYQGISPVRAFTSVKTTVKDTELYAEGLVALGRTFLEPIPGGAAKQVRRVRTWDTLDASFSVGVAQGFFKGKLWLNGEFYYNGEQDAYWFRESDEKRGIEEKVTPFIKGANFALNIQYKPGVLGITLGAQFRYGLEEKTGLFVPGFAFSPGRHVTIRIAVPVALGSREGTYYTNNIADRPFSIALAVTVAGSHRFSHYW